MTYKEYIETRKRKWVGKNVQYDGGTYKVVDVDYNGMLIINKRARFIDRTAVSTQQIEVAQ